MNVREAGPADRDAVISLWEACALTRPWNDPGLDFDRAVAGETSAVLVGAEDGVVVAAAMVGHDGHRGWVYYVAVRPDLQGRHRGEAIMRDAEAWLRTAGAVKVQLMVRESNADVIGFYEAIGYERDPVLVLGRWLVGRGAGGGVRRDRA